MKAFSMRALVLCVAIVLSACGGGGGGSMEMARPELTPMPLLLELHPGNRQTSPFANLTDRLSGLTQDDPEFGSVRDAIAVGVPRPTEIGTRLETDRRVLTIYRGEGETTTLDTDRDAILEESFQPQNPRTNRLAFLTSMYSGEPDFTTATYVTEVSATDLTDYVSLGGWIHAPEEGGLEFGGFVDGREFDTDIMVPLLGTATYEGRANGLYASRAGTDVQAEPNTLEQGEYHGLVSLVADFEANSISGDIDNIVLEHVNVFPPDGSGTFEENYHPGPIATDYRMVFNPTPLQDGGLFVGRDIDFTTNALDITSSNFTWAGRFSDVNDPVGNPRAVAGTTTGSFRTSGGTFGVLSGAFYGATEQFQ